METCFSSEHIASRKYSRRDQAAYVVYWIVDKSYPSVPLYVGVTKNLDRRWGQHRSGSKELDGIQNRDSITIRVIETIVGTFADAEKIELQHIKSAASQNPCLLNRKRNLRLQMEVKSKRTVRMSRICVTIPHHLAEWAKSQPKASTAVAAAIQFYLDSVKPKRGRNAAAKRAI